MDKTCELPIIWIVVPQSMTHLKDKDIENVVELTNLMITVLREALDRGGDFDDSLYQVN